ncbi:hypothetical protein HanIR_Chr02g0052331 [Helianthus annuus]|nr:hypothetical protein HanIR_Chr02g0052331 [Helianthus annuus]
MGKLLVLTNHSINTGMMRVPNTKKVVFILGNPVGRRMIIKTSMRRGMRTTDMMKVTM